MKEAYQMKKLMSLLLISVSILLLVGCEKSEQETFTIEFIELKKIDYLSEYPAEAIFVSHEREKYYSLKLTDYAYNNWSMKQGDSYEVKAIKKSFFENDFSGNDFFYWIDGAEVPLSETTYLKKEQSKGSE